MRAAEIERLQRGLEDRVFEGSQRPASGLRPPPTAGRRVIELRRRAGQHRDIGEARRQQLLAQRRRASASAVSPATSTARAASCAIGPSAMSGQRAGVEHEIVVALAPAHRPPTAACGIRSGRRHRHRRCPADDQMRRANSLSRVMMSPNDAAPRTRSAMPGADGSFEITSMFGDFEGEIDQHHARSCGPARAPARSRCAWFRRRARLPITATRRPPSPARRSAATTSIDRRERGRLATGSSGALRQAPVQRERRSRRRPGRRRGRGVRRAAARRSTTDGHRAAYVRPAWRGPVRRSAARRSPRMPTLRQNVPSAAISTIGTFFGEDGRLDTTAREMMRASAGAAAMLSRAVASRYFAR